MATTAELERLIIRIMGDGSHYKKILDDAMKQTQDAMNKLQAKSKEAQLQNGLLQDAARITSALKTPTENYAATMANLKAHLATGRISQDTFNKAMAQAKRELDMATPAVTRFSDRLRSAAASARNFGIMWSLFVSTPIIGFLKGAAGAAFKMDTLKRGLMAVTGSAEGVAAAMLKVDEIAKLPGLGYFEAGEGIRDLLATGRFELEQATTTLKAFGSAIATTGGGKAELSAVMRQVVQMMGVGKIMEVDLRIIKSYIPGLSKAMETVFGTSNAQKIEKMGVSAEQFLTLISAEFLRTSNITGGARNDIENLGDAWIKAQATIGEAVLQFAPAINIVAGLVKKLAEWFSSLSQEVQTTIIIVAGIIAVFGPLAIALSAIIGLMGTLVAVMSGPVGWIALVVGLLAVVAGTFAARKAMKAMQDEAAAAAKNVKKATGDVTGPKFVPPDTAAMKAEEKAMKDLKKEAESLLKSVKTPFEVLEDKIQLATRALKAGVIEMADFRRIADDVALDKLKLEMESYDKEMRGATTAKAGKIALRGTAAEFTARREGVVDAREMARIAKRGEVLAERRTVILEAILAEAKSKPGAPTLIAKTVKL